MLFLPLDNTASPWFRYLTQICSSHCAVTFLRGSTEGRHQVPKDRLWVRRLGLLKQLLWVIKPITLSQDLAGLSLKRAADLCPGINCHPLCSLCGFTSAFWDRPHSHTCFLEWSFCSCPSVLILTLADLPGICSLLAAQNSTLRLLCLCEMWCSHASLRRIQFPNGSVVCVASGDLEWLQSYAFLS